VSTTVTRTPAKTNYLNNRDILKEIHLSKNTYCTYRDPVLDHQYDIILPTVEKINQRTIAEARRNRADRLKREGTIVDPKKFPTQTLCLELPVGNTYLGLQKKCQKQQSKRKRSKTYLN
jgi:hypothetical protein